MAREVFREDCPGVAIWHNRSASTLNQVMVCCLMAPNHYPTNVDSLTMMPCGIHLKASWKIGSWIYSLKWISKIHIDNHHHLSSWTDELTHNNLTPAGIVEQLNQSCPMTLQGHQSFHRPVIRGPCSGSLWLQTGLLRTSQTNYVCGHLCN